MSQITKKTLYIIDGSSFLYRAYYGLRPLHTSDGTPVQAVYGFCSMIKKMMQQFHPSHMALIWDSKGKTKRHEFYGDYKGTRQAPPSDLFIQKDYIREFADLIGLCQVIETGVEADDLVYSLAKEWVDAGGNVVVITADKDIGQMLSPDISLYDSFNQMFYDQKSLEEKLQMPVSKIPFYYGLMGDSSDNIPGVKGIGKKTAFDLVSQFESLEVLYQNLDAVESKRVRSALENNKEDAFLSYKLFLLYYHKTHTNLDETSFSESNWVHAAPLFQKLEFKQFLKSMPTSSVSVTDPLVRSSVSKGYSFITVQDLSLLETIIAAIKEKKVFAYDTEGNGINALEMDMVGLSVSYQQRLSYYIPCGHKTDEKQLLREQIIALVKPLFEDRTIVKIAHHAKFDQLVLSNYGITVQGPVFDTLIAAALVTPEWQKNSLKALSAYYLEEPMLTFDAVVTEKKRKDFSEVPLVEATEYAAADAHQTLKLYELFKPMLKEQEMDTLFYDIEIPVMHLLTEMERKGIECHVSVLESFNVVVERKIFEIEGIIKNILGPEFSDLNLNSPRQIEDILFNYLKLPPQKKSAKGTSYSTDNEVLVALSPLHPIPKYLVYYRELFKLKTTYIDALPLAINKKTGRIHTNYSQTRVATGRLSSSDPNLQNIPVQKFGSEIRAAFVPEKGRLFISADYSQIELRVLAFLSQDAVLKKAFLDNRDIHAETAAGLFKVPFDEVTQQQRAFGKKINFSILYGLTPYGLSKDLHISQGQAKEYIDSYFLHYPKVREWMDAVVVRAREDSYVQTFYKRRRYVKELQEKNKHAFDAGKRVAINTVAQGTAAELMKLGMIALHKAFIDAGVDAYMVLQIHDELLISVKEEVVDKVKELTKTALEKVVAWDVPLVVTIKEGINWKEVK